MSPVDPATLLVLAERVAREAGALVAEGRRRGGLRVVAKSTPTDMVSEMDTAAEELLVRLLLAERPDDGILGEEGGTTVGTSGVQWVLDPIDGTTNYLYGIAQYAVSVAARVDGEVVAGVVHDPETPRTFTATLGGGAYLDGARLHCNDLADLSQAMVATGFGYAAGRRAVQGRVLAALVPQVRDVRRFGAASLDLCTVATGQVDAYYERGLKPWDLAAGGLVAREAGVRVEGLRGAAAGEELVIAAPAALFDLLHDVLAPLGADSDD